MITEKLKRSPDFYLKAKSGLSCAKDTIKCQKMTYRQYEYIVRKLTSFQPLYVLNNFEKRGFNGWHLDHIISIRYGYDNNMPFEEIASIANLQMIPKKENNLKQNQSYSVISACNHLLNVKR